MEQGWAWWIGFNIFILLMLALDLGVFHRRSHEVRLPEAIVWSIVWIIVALLFNIGLWVGWFGNYPAHERRDVATNFFIGYVLERSLSFDNLFVFAVIFSYFAVELRHQHRVLYYGILGALIFRALFIFGGLWLIEKFEWMIYVFGVFLVYTGVKLATTKEKEIEPEKNPVIRAVRAILPVSPRYDGKRFFTRVDGRLMATPLLLVLVFLEFTDVVFALDSIPAIIGVTTDSFIVYTSNIFAILGLRAMYFVLAAVMKLFRYLSMGLAVLLVYIGGKMVVEEYTHTKVDPILSLAIVTIILTIAIAASLLRPVRKVAEEPPDAVIESGECAPARYETRS